jgi:hypothetical protein
VSPRGDSLPHPSKILENLSGNGRPFRPLCRFLAKPRGRIQHVRPSSPEFPQSWPRLRHAPFSIKRREIPCRIWASAGSSLESDGAKHREGQGGVEPGQGREADWSRARRGHPEGGRRESARARPPDVRGDREASGAAHATRARDRLTPNGRVGRGSRT